MTTWVCTRQNELTHHGIKGMKWGVRRFQNKDGSLTPEGKRRYDEPNQQSNSSPRSNHQSSSNAKKYKIPKNKSLHRLKLEEKYMKQGMSREEAEQAAAKRIRTEQFVAVAAGVTVASCLAYAKYKGYTSDKVIKSDSEFQRIMRLAENEQIREGRQYLAFDKKDKIKYKGLLGSSFETQIKAQKKIDEKDIKEAVYDVTVKNKDKINIASRKRAEDAFMKLYKEDPVFRKNLIRRGKELQTQLPSIEGLNKKMGNGDKLNDYQLRKHGYDLFNILLGDHDKSSADNANKFYDVLRKQGVNAIVDVNDKKYSGYNTKAPIIVFDGKFDYTKREMSKSEIASYNKKANDLLLRPELVKAGSMLTGTLALSPIISKVTIDKRVLQYKEAHPNSKMSDAEIRQMVKKELEDQMK